MKKIHWGSLVTQSQWRAALVIITQEIENISRESDMEEVDLLWKQIEEFLMQCPPEFQNLIEQVNQLAEHFLDEMSFRGIKGEVLKNEDKNKNLETTNLDFAEILADVEDLCAYELDIDFLEEKSIFSGAGEVDADMLGLNNEKLLKAKSKQKIKYQIIKVFHATDRKPTNNSEPANFYGHERGELHYGICEVSIPKNHKTGKLESPSVFRLEFRENPEKHVALLKITEQEKENFFLNLSEEINQSEKKSAFIFVHGYNVSFEDAARRTAQMAYDLKFEGAPVFYSWPSHAKLLKYTADENNVEWSQRNFEVFIKDFCDKTDAENIYLIAHSMGNRCLTKGIKELVEANPAIRTRFREIILTAPDIDADIFKEQIAPVIALPNTPITLYASSKDKALRLSQKLHGGYPRAGESGDGLVLAGGIETIDATDVDTSLVGHGYFSGNRTVLSDIYYLLKNMRADERDLMKVNNPPKRKYWVFSK